MSPGFHDTVKPKFGQIILQLQISITAQRELNLYFRLFVVPFFPPSSLVKICQ